MKIKLTTPILEPDGTEAKEPKFKKGVQDGFEPLTARIVIRKSLNFLTVTNPYTGEREQIEPEDSYKRGKLSMRLMKGDTADLTVDEISLIKPLIPKAGYPPTTVVQIYDLLEGE